MKNHEYKILSHLFPSIVWIKDTDAPNVYLTFDDGPHPKYTPEILDILKAYHSKATFFIIGKQASQYPQIVSRIAREGHAIGLHSYSHNKLIFMYRQQLVDELLTPQKILNEIVGFSPTIFRPPYGYFTPRLLMLSQQLRLTVAMWTLMSYDFNIKISDQKIVNKVIRQLKDGAIIVFHDGHQNSGRTVRILPKIIEIILQEGKLLSCL